MPLGAEEIATELKTWSVDHIGSIEARKPSEEFNGTMMQFFHWYYPSDGSLWKFLSEETENLAKVGFSALWLPPAYKGLGGANDVGYGVYDLFDLGEFDQKGTVRTKYGTKSEYVNAVKLLKEKGIQTYIDVVLNHRMGADFEEEFEATPYHPQNRNHSLGETRKIRAWTGFQFPGRRDQYSTMKWNWQHFDSVDYNSLDPNFKAIWKMKGKDFEGKVDLESGNFDYLMGCDLDMNHPEVIQELIHWGKWSLDLLGADGFRLDALKHINGDFFNTWLDALEAYAKKDLYCVGEYWTYDLPTLAWYIGNAGGRMDLFDAPLHLNFHKASRSGGNFDMRTIFDNTLMKEFPLFAVTIVENHDTQPLQALESPVETWFKPLAYAMILLRSQGYPCIFFADYYGAQYVDKGKDGNQYEINIPSLRSKLDLLMSARQFYAHGPQYDYIDHFNCIGWTRLGSPSHPHSLAVLLSDGAEGRKWMETGKPNQRYRDLMGECPDAIQTNEHGWAEFVCRGGSVSVWIEEGIPI
ncbi:glycosidase [Leptospira ryugenii]|uniref:Glycosidase n=1 Tax=Leptospira ryugenii TaxID=1917863 RepID=A0A2P2E404_9LEPT|nr:glycosidase [Leptospira ryugenii]